MAINILIADDHEIMREGLKNILEKDKDLIVIAEADNGHQTIEKAHSLKPDIIIMDIGMPDLNGIEATRIITQDFPAIKVLALSMYSGKKFILEVLKAGAKGYLVKDCASSELINAIKTVAGDNVYLSPKIAHIVVNDYVDKSTITESASEKLSARERQVLQLIAEGWNTKQIALKMNISSKTVDTYRQRIMSKLEIYNIADLIKYAINEGITYIDV